MFPLAVCCLLITQCFARELGRHGDQPEDEISSVAPNIDDINEKDWTIPDAKFFYNYEQIRKDQPDQIEQRQDNPGNYVYRYPKTTTSTTSSAPKLIFDDFEENNDKSTEFHGLFDTSVIVFDSASSHHHHHHRHHHPKQPNHIALLPNFPEKQEDNADVYPKFPTHSWGDWNYQSKFPAKMPPPPTLPEWKDLNELLNQHPYHQHLTRNKVLKAHRISRHKGAKQHEQTNAASPMKVASRKNVEPNPSPAQIDIRNKDKYINRGTHKFSWDDENQESTSSPANSTTANMFFQKGNSPPPVPILSPWYDGFGK